MIVSVGADIVKVKRIKEVLFRRAERFKKKILSKEELQEMPESREIEYVAKRFAAKEAISKVLGTGIAFGVKFTDIIIRSDKKSGAPRVVLEGEAKKKAASLGIQRILISISDEKEYALAFAIGVASR
ncbi:MAG: holo-ACP synthase [Gammaproteobacteria bacterium]|nr:holo-ACP synthase [Gammaproteobacteria bacterium]|tara:strand:- start:400 stop:783 length:384 start_codon:yes stop_codon:yes gene_type:complete